MDGVLAVVKAVVEWMDPWTPVLCFSGSFHDTDLKRWNWEFMLTEDSGDCVAGPELYQWLPGNRRCFSLVFLLSALSELTSVFSMTCCWEEHSGIQWLSHLSQRFLGSHDGTPHPYERPLWCVGPKDCAGSETFSVRAEVKLEKETRDGDGCADAQDDLLQTQSFRNGFV